MRKGNRSSFEMRMDSSTREHLDRLSVLYGISRAKAIKLLLDPRYSQIILNKILGSPELRKKIIEGNRYGF